MLDVARTRRLFPILERRIGGRPIVFADNAATSLKPIPVIGAVEHYYTHVCANVHRGVNILAQEADALYEGARARVARFIGAVPEQVVFVRNATEGINLAAHLLDLSPGDEVLCTASSHHSNFLPWLASAEVKRIAGGPVDVDAVKAAITPRTRLVAVEQACNVTGWISPVREIIAAARERGVPTLVDAAQSVGHIPIDVRELGCGFLAFSGHKMLGPSGIGALFARRDFLEAGRPMLYGGGMVSEVTHSSFEAESLPHKYEAGTPNIEGAIGLGAAVAFLEELSMEAIEEHSTRLSAALFAELGSLPALRLVAGAHAEGRLPIASFELEGMDSDDVASLLCTRHAIMARSGTHCSQPFLRDLGAANLVRVSLYLYNTLEEVGQIARALGSLCETFGLRPRGR